ncbi:MAG TPA: C40 family peptidase [Gaiellaceae bacterium]|jgi:cell wall-associated NlpC family hydrolase|nr:C40 family peptidase [Gaiellaceae bacterium]
MSSRLRSRVPVLCLTAAIAAAAVVPANAATSSGHPRPHPIVDATSPTRAELAARFALDEVGVPYRWGGESPASGFDCSGLVRWAYGRVGIDLPHSSYALYGEGRRVSGNLERGDILFFEGLGHVGLYLGKGRMVHAPQTGRNVEVVRLAGSNYGMRLVAARRVVAS